MNEFQAPRTPEFIHQPEVAQLTSRANLDPSIFERARYETLHQTGATFDIRQLQDMDGQGLVALIGAGDSALRLYAMGEGANKSIYLTPGIMEETKEGALQAVNLVPIDSDTSRWFGRERPFKTRLGLTEDTNLDPSHFIVERKGTWQLLIQDISSTGTTLITKEAPRPNIDSIVRKPIEDLFGRVVIKDQLDKE